MNLQTSGPIQSTIFNVQCTGLEGGLLSCSYETVISDMSCESAAAGIVCQGFYTLIEIAVHIVHVVHACLVCIMT